MPSLGALNIIVLTSLAQSSPDFFRYVLTLTQYLQSGRRQPSPFAKSKKKSFSSAFNKMLPYILSERLASYFNLPDQLLMLILSFLTQQVQQVFFYGQMSKTSMENTGSLQGCV